MGTQRAYNLKPSLPECGGRETYFNLPNTLTLSRILVIPVFVFLFSNPTPDRSITAAFVFLVAALTDLLDGYLARRRGQITNLGKLLDPVADKLLVASALILLVQFERVEVWLAILMIARELIVTGARAVAAKEGFVVPADSFGKLKVVCHIQIPFFDLHIIGTLVLYVALAVALISGTRYLIEILKKISPQFL
jgi:CDP-diacylglycerol--glycerol-3-phosphate 3-phosphatidyltransferase